MGGRWVTVVDLLGLLGRSTGLVVMGEAWQLSLVVFEGFHSGDLSVVKTY